MKRLFALHHLFFLLFCTFSVFGQKPFAFDESGYENVMKSAKLQKKPVFYMIYASWCPHCHKMRDEIFPDKEVSEFLQKNYLVAAQDIEVGDGRALAKKFGVSGYPAFVVLDTDGNLLYGFAGEWKKPDFLNEIREATNPERQFPYLRKAFANEPSDGNRALALILALRKAGLPANETTVKYLSTQKDEQLVSALNWRIIANGLSDMDTREFRYVLKHQKEFASVASEKRVERKIENIAVEALKSNAESKDTIHYKKQRELVKAINLRKTDSVGYVYDKQLYENVKAWKAYRNTTLASTEKFDWKHYANLRNVCGVYAAEIDDREALRTAVKWSERATQLQESKESYLQTARLYEKLGEKQKAVASAQSARDFCLKVGFGTKEADEMLTRLQSK